MRPTLIVALGLTSASMLCGQQFRFDLANLESKASNSFHVRLNAPLVQFAASFLDDKDPAGAKAKTLVVRLTGIYVARFEFNKEGVWAQSDLERVRNQLTGPEWSPVVSNIRGWDGEEIELRVHRENDKVSGVAILISGPRGLTVANLVGNVDPYSLADIGGHFELPKIRKNGSARESVRPPGFIGFP